MGGSGGCGRESFLGSDVVCASVPSGFKFLTRKSHYLEWFTFSMTSPLDREPPGRVTSRRANLGWGSIGWVAHLQLEGRIVLLEAEIRQLTTRLQVYQAPGFIGRPTSTSPNLCNPPPMFSTGPCEMRKAHGNAIFRVHTNCSKNSPSHHDDAFNRSRGLRAKLPPPESPLVVPVPAGRLPPSRACRRA